jgi:hypothetical protein
MLYIKIGLTTVEVRRADYRSAKYCQVVFYNGKLLKPQFL